MTNFYPTDPKKIRERIKRYERAFKDPNHDDGAGKRLILGQLYMLMGDTDGALRSYSWYKMTFPDEIVEPFNHLCWTLALLRTGDEIAARSKLRELVFDQLYIVPIFFGEMPFKLEIWHGYNWREPDYVLQGPKDEIFSIWNESERRWLRHEWESKTLKSDVQRYIELMSAHAKATDSEIRSKLSREAERIARGLRLVSF